jgi:phytanoyl-CoA hydroxylase
MLWIDRDDAVQKIAQIRHPKIRAAVEELRERGVTRLLNAVPMSLCDGLVEDFHKFCRQNSGMASEATQQEGFRSRLYNLHSLSDSGLAIALNPLVLSVLDTIFSERAALNTTLYFEQSSQQEVHRDTPFFMTNRYPGEFVGVWFALEDVHEESGPLMYFPGAHRVPIDLEKARAAGDADPSRVTDMFREYNRLLRAGIEAGDFQEERLLIRKGDAAIWHPELPHGGSAIAGFRRSRHSLVAHYMPEGAYVQTVGYFFGLEPEKQIMEFMDAGSGRLRRWSEPPRFMPNS